MKFKEKFYQILSEKSSERGLDDIVEIQNEGKGY